MYIYMLYMCKLRFFFSRTFFPQLSLALTVLLVSLQAHDGHGAKIQGPGMLRMLRKVVELDLVP